MNRLRAPFFLLGILLCLLLAAGTSRAEDDPADPPPAPSDFPEPDRPAPDAPAPDVPAPRGLDVVVHVNGSVWKGRIVREDEDRIVLAQGSDSGGTAEITLRREDIKSIKRGIGGPPPKGGSRAVRDEWFLLRSGGRIVGTRHLELWSVNSGGVPGYRLEERRHFFAQGPQLPATRTELVEYTDLAFVARLVSYREVGEASSDRDGPPRTERTVSGRIQGGMWNGASSSGGNSRSVKVPLATGTFGRLGFREHLLRLDREVRLHDARILDPNAEGLVKVRAGFASIPLTPAEKKRGNEFHWEEEGRRLISFFRADTSPLTEEISEGVTAVPVSREQARAASGTDGDPSGGEPGQAEIRLAEAGIGFALPDRLWTWKPTVASATDTGWRVLGNLDTRVFLADVRIEWHPREPGDETDPVQVEGWLLRRLRGACPDLLVSEGRRGLPGLEGAWRMDFTGTLKGESVRSIAVVVDRPLGRVVLLLACPVAAWEQGGPALDRFIASLQLL